jgi:hypothetical protein
VSSAMARCQIVGLATGVGGVTYRTSVFGN